MGSSYMDEESSNYTETESNDSTVLLLNVELAPIAAYTNWNNVPSLGFSEPSAEASSPEAGPFDRRLIHLLQDAQEHYLGEEERTKRATSRLEIERRRREIEYASENSMNFHLPSAATTLTRRQSSPSVERSPSRERATPTPLPSTGTRSSPASVYVTTDVNHSEENIESESSRTVYESPTLKAQGFSPHDETTAPHSSVPALHGLPPYEEKNACRSTVIEPMRGYQTFHPSTMSENVLASPQGDIDSNYPDFVATRESDEGAASSAITRVEGEKMAESALPEVHSSSKVSPKPSSPQEVLPSLEKETPLKEEEIEMPPKAEKKETPFKTEEKVVPSEMDNEERVPTIEGRSRLPTMKPKEGLPPIATSTADKAVNTPLTFSPFASPIKFYSTTAAVSGMRRNHSAPRGPPSDKLPSVSASFTSHSPWPPQKSLRGSSNGSKRRTGSEEHMRDSQLPMIDELYSASVGRRKFWGMRKYS